eukprot:COSAG06_NODE_119_length_23111_cov_51.658613_26_plen_215_part_00
MSTDPIISKKLMPSDDVPGQMLTLLLELLRSGELPELAIGGAWAAVFQCLLCQGLATLAMELGLIDLAVQHLQAIGSPADVVSISHGEVGRAHFLLNAVNELTRDFVGQATRPDLELCVSSGLFDIWVGMITAVAAIGAEGLADTNHCSLHFALSCVGKCGTQRGCEAKIRSMATALSFCLENSLEFIEELALTTGSAAASLCCSIFGRDEYER